MPPKKSNKACRNAFFYFMLEIKQRQGRNIRNLEEAAKVAGPLWSNMSAKEKEPYQIMARQEKYNQQDMKYTSLGTSIAQIEKEEDELKQQEQSIRQDTQKIVEMLTQTDKIATHFFYIIHINNFCYSNMFKRNYPAEIGVSRFSLLDGVKSEKVFHRIIHPGPLPLGYSFEAKKNSDATHQLAVPTGQQAPDNTEEVFNDLLAFLLEISSDVHDLPIMYAREREIAFILKTLKCFARDFGQDERKFKVYSLEYLLFVLINNVAGKQVWPAVSLSTEEIERDVYDFTLEIACEYHQTIDVPVFCSKAIVTRLAYVVCDNCCKYLDVELEPGRHIPSKAKLQQCSFRADTASCASSVADDQESVSSYGINESDRCNSSLSFISTETFDNAFPALGEKRRYNTNSDASTSNSRSSYSARGVWGRGRPVELPSALANREQELTQPPRSQGRGRGIMACRKKY